MIYQHTRGGIGMKEPKVMRELHKIREEMSKLSHEERMEQFKRAEKEYKRLIAG